MIKSSSFDEYRVAFNKTLKNGKKIIQILIKMQIIAELYWSEMRITILLLFWHQIKLNFFPQIFCIILTWKQSKGSILLGICVSIILSRLYVVSHLYLISIREQLNINTMLDFFWFASLLFSRQKMPPFEPKSKSVPHCLVIEIAFDTFIQWTRKKKKEEEFTFLCLK